MKGYREVDLPIDDSTLPSLEGLTKDDIIRTLRLVVPPQAVTRVVNRLHNKQHDRQATTIKAFQLTSQGFEPMAEIDIDVNEFSAHGQITNALDIGNNDSIAVTIYNRKNRKETTYLVGREDPVRIWRKERIQGTRGLPEQPDYDAVADHGYLTAEYIAGHLDSFFGKRMSVKYQGTGKLVSMGTHGGEPDVYYFTLEGVGRVRVEGKQTVEVHKKLREGPGFMRPGPYPWAKAFPDAERVLDEASRRMNAATLTNTNRPDYTVDAYRMAVGDSIPYRGMIAELKPGLKGVLTQVMSDNEGKVLFVIDGIIYKRNRGHRVKLWRKKEN